MTILILADDLTGAADTAARCHQAGLPATIYVQPPASPLPAGAVALTSDSRHLSAAEAAQRVRRIVARLPVAQVDYLRSEDTKEQVINSLYKKIDSTLRGNIGSELDATLAYLSHADHPACAVICPAFPAQGRGLQDGHLMLEQTQITDAHLPALLKQQSTYTVMSIPLRDVQSGMKTLAKQLTAAHNQGGQLLVVDAMTDADLRVIVEATLRALPHALFCGSAGLANVVALQVAQSRGETTNAALDENAAFAARALVIVGSGSSVARQQVDALRQVDNVCIWEAQAAGKNDIVVKDMDDVCVLHLPLPVPNSILDGPRARALAEHLATLALLIYAQMQPSLLLLAGGDTSMSVLKHLGIVQLQVVRELMPGIPLTRAIDKDGRTLYVVLKPGSFGDEQTLAALIQPMCDALSSPSERPTFSAPSAHA